MKKSLVLLFILPLFAFTAIHKYYVALTEIEFNKEKQSVQMIMNVFMDDIELALKNEFDIDAQISNPKELKNIDEYFEKYLQKHFKININNTSKEISFLGKEYDGNIVFFYFEVENISDVKSIDIQNTVLVKEYSDQQNLVKAKVNSQRKSLFLSKENDKGLLKF